jgi:hypothetical protein
MMHLLFEVFRFSFVVVPARLVWSDHTARVQIRRLDASRSDYERNPNSEKSGVKLTALETDDRESQ